MEAGVDHDDHHAETEMVAKLAREPGSGILGIISSIRPEKAPGFDAWVEEGRDLGVVGYRRMLHVVPDDLSRTETFRANIRKLGAARAARSTWCSLPASFRSALELAQACPDTKLVLDHCGNPDIAAGPQAIAPWRAGLADARRHAERLCQALGGLRQRRARHGEPRDRAAAMSSR